MFSEKCEKPMSCCDLILKAWSPKSPAKTVHQRHPSIMTVALVGIVLSSFASAQEAQTNMQIDWSAMATAHSPAQPIPEFLDEWDAPLDSGDHAYAQGRASIEVRPTGSVISYGLGWRYDYLLTFSEQTAAVYWQYKNEAPASTSQNFPLFLEAKHNERIGANIGFTQNITPTCPS